MAEEILQYQPPKSMSFGQVTIPRNPIKAWEALSQFLNEYTIYEEFSDISIRYNTWKIKIDEDVETKCLQALNQLCGQSDAKLDITQLEEALQLVFETCKWAKQKGPPVTVEFHCRFQWKDVYTAELFPGQDKGHNTKNGELHSYCLFYIDYKVFIQPSLSFPYAYGASEGMEHLELIKHNIPFRFSEKHLRRLLPTKMGRYRYLKLAKK